MTIAAPKAGFKLLQKLGLESDGTPARQKTRPVTEGLVFRSVAWEASGFVIGIDGNRFLLPTHDAPIVAVLATRGLRNVAARDDVSITTSSSACR